jgi:hypothetical protein
MSSPTTTNVRLPHAHLPATVLPGAVITISLNTDELRRAIDAATNGTDASGRLILTGGDEHTLGVIARVPNIGNLPNGDPAAIVQIESRARIVSSPVDDSALDAPALGEAAEPPHHWDMNEHPSRILCGFGGSSNEVSPAPGIDRACG